MNRLVICGMALVLVAGGCGPRKVDGAAAAEAAPPADAAPVAGAVPVAGAAPAAGEGAPLSPDSKLQQGRSMFRHLCAGCHGQEGEGGRAKALNRPELRDKYPTEADLAKRIEEGDPAGGMPPCADQLRPQDLEALTAYVYSLFQ